MVHAPVPMLRIPDLHPLLDPEYAPYDLGVMGELDVRILAELFGGREIAQALSPDWAGGMYYAAQRRSATAAQKETPASLGLLYYSHWKNRDSARSFMRVYAGQLARKYQTVARRSKDETDDSEQVYGTNEGDVLLSISGRDVFVSEGFALPLARQLRQEIAGAQGVGAVQTAQLPEPELSFGFARELASFGVVKSALGTRYTQRGADESRAAE